MIIFKEHAVDFAMQHIQNYYDSDFLQKSF